MKLLKKEKKVYVAPQIEIVEVEIEQSILSAGSPGGEGEDWGPIN